MFSGILLDGGRVAMDGPISDVIKAYKGMISRCENGKRIARQLPTNSESWEPQEQKRLQANNWLAEFRLSGRRGDSRLNTDQPITRLTSALRTTIPLR